MAEEKNLTALAYPSNSMVSKAKDEAEIDIGDEQIKPKVTKVVTNAVKTKKKPWWKRLGEKFLADDAETIKEYILFDTIGPAIKDLIFEIVSGSFEMALFGSRSSSIRKKRGGSNGTYVSYNSMYDKHDKRDRERRTSSRSARDIEDIIFETRGEADDVLATLDDLLDRYREVTVADLYDLVGISPKFTDQKYGWTDLGRASVRRSRGGYILDLPRPQALD